MTTFFDILLSQYKSASRVKDAAHIAPNDLAFLQQVGQAGEANLSDTWEALVQQVRATTSVAVLSYQFFTGKAPRESGLDYLVSPEGPNPNNLNSAIYQHFSLENRFINFAVNLGKSGDGSAQFGADYGGLTLREATAKAYQTIFGVAASAAKVSNLLDTQVMGTMSRAQYLSLAAGDTLEGVGTKAALVGWLLAEAAKTDVAPHQSGGTGFSFVIYPVLGPYAYALHGFLVDLARDGHARFDEDLIANYNRGGAYVYDGPLDEGAPGLTIQLDGTSELAAPRGDLNGFQASGYATDGNDLIASEVGYQAGHALYGGEGNDTFTITGGPSRVSIFGGEGNDVVNIETFAGGSIVGGFGQNTFNINGAGPLTLDPVGHVILNALPWVFFAEITHAQGDWIGADELQHDRINLGPGFGPTQMLTATFAGSTTFDEALGWVATQTAAGATSVFRFGLDAFVYHQNGVAGVDAADGLIRILGGAGDLLDLHFT